MAVYTDLSSEDISGLLERYDLGRLTSAKGIAEGVENSNFMLLVEKNGSATPYILTIYEKRVKTEDLPFFMGLMHQLADRGIPCPVPVPARNGETIVQIEGKSAVIVTFLSGTSARLIRNEHVAALGAATAGMHLAAEGFALSRPNALSLAGWHGMFDKIASRLDEITPGLRTELGDELAWLDAHWPATLPSGVIHADLFPDNVFFEGDRLSGIIDFYFACNDILIYDLVITMNAWCFERGIGIRQGELNITKARRLLESYHAVRPLSDAEMEAMPTLARGAALRFLLTRAHDWLFPVEGALVKPKDPMEYIAKLRFHRQVKSHLEYGL